MSKLRVKEIAHSNGTNATTINSSGTVTFSNSPVGVGMTHIASATATTAAIDAFHINGCFSADYDYYKIFYRVNRPGTDGSILSCQFGNGGTLITSGVAVRGCQNYSRLISGGDGQQNYYSTSGVHQIAGSLAGVANEHFTGELTILNPFSSTIPTAVKNTCIMYQIALGETAKWSEEGASSEDIGDATSATDFRINLVAGNPSGSDIASTATFGAVNGNITVFGLKT